MKTVVNNAYHRTLLLLLTVFMLVLDSELLAKSPPSFDKSKQLEIYLDYAFADSSQLRKFEFSPILGIVCKAQDYCGPLRDEVSPFIPSFTTVELKDTYDPNDEISIFLVPEDYQQAINSIQLAKKNGVVFRWGTKECSVTQIVDKHVVLKLLIYIDMNEGKRRNAVCLASELLVGSGGGTKTQHHRLIEFFETSKYSTYAQFQNLVLLSLHYHWSTLLPPGLNRKQAESVLREFLFETR